MNSPESESDGLSRETEDLRKLNQQLLDSEQRLRLALETGRIGLWVWNSSDVDNAGDWSPRLKEIFGVPLGAEVTHDLFLKCVHPDDRERVDRAVMQAVSGVDGGRYQMEYRAVHPGDGSVHWVTARGQAFFDAGGKPFRFIGTVMDITDRKEAEMALGQVNLELEERIALRTSDLARVNEALERSQSDLLLAIDTIPGLVWIGRPDGHVEYHNKRWLEYTGMRQEDSVGWGWRKAIHPDDLPSLVSYWQSLLATGQAGEYEARLRRHDGEYRWFLFRGVPLYNKDGRLVRWYGMNTDVEARRASEHLARGQLETLTRMLQVLAEEDDPDQLPRHVVNAILTQLGAFSVTIWERNGEQLDLLGVTEEGHYMSGEDAGYFEGSIPVTGAAPPLWAEGLQTGEHVMIEDIDKEPSRILLADGRTAVWRQEDLTRPFANLKAHLAAQGVRGLLIAPMSFAGRLAGIIGIRFKGTRVFEREEINLTKALAHQAMLAIQLMRLSQQSRQAAVVSERNRMARDIHDTLAQGFTGVIVQLEAAEDARSRGLMNECDAHLASAQELARESLREARASVQALRPQVLAHKNLCAALSEMMGKMTRGTTMECDFVSVGEPFPLPRGWDENILRLGQEALTNALRHAHATRFHGRLEFSENLLLLEFSDNGRGFDAEAAHDGLGLVGMKERVAAMRGELTFRSGPGKGTILTVVLHPTSIDAVS